MFGIPLPPLVIVLSVATLPLFIWFAKNRRSDVRRQLSRVWLILGLLTIIEELASVFWVAYFPSGLEWLLLIDGGLLLLIIIASLLPDSFW